MSELKQPGPLPPQSKARHAIGSERPVPFERAAALVLGAMQSAVTDLFNAIPGGVRKQADLEKAFGVDRKLCWQVYRIATASNPLAAGTNVPARVSLDRLLKAASRRRVTAAVIDRISSAFDDFDRLVVEYAGDREEFDSLLAAALPDEREKMLLASRESMYESARNIRGCAEDVALCTAIYFPARDDTAKLDAVRLFAHIGLRRVRRGARVQHGATSTPPELLTIDGRAVNGLADVALTGFSSSPQQPFSFRAESSGAGDLRYVLEGDDVGIAAAVDDIVADFMPAYRSRYGTAARPVIAVINSTVLPARRQVLDVLVCEGVAMRQEPDVRVYDMIPAGKLTGFPAPDRECDRVAFQPAARYMGTGIEAFRCTHVRRYEEMLAHICEKRGWDGSKLHGYRVEIEYPVYSWQTVLALKLPAGP